MDSFAKLMEWSLKTDEVLAGNTSSLAAAALMLACEAHQVTRHSNVAFICCTEVTLH